MPTFSLDGRSVSVFNSGVAPESGPGPTSHERAMIVCVGGGLSSAALVLIGIVPAHLLQELRPAFDDDVGEAAPPRFDAHVASPFRRCRKTVAVPVSLFLLTAAEKQSLSLSKNPSAGLSV